MIFLFFSWDATAVHVVEPPSAVVDHPIAVGTQRFAVGARPP
jgi:hypothetical protein